jgi:hypothetical protein
LITGVKLRDRVSVPDLLERVDIRSINGMVVSAVAMETWNCRHSSDGGNGAKNFVGSLILTRARRSRSPVQQQLGWPLYPLRGRDTFVSNRARMWNASEALRVASSKSSARLAAKI